MGGENLSLCIFFICLDVWTKWVYFSSKMNRNMNKNERLIQDVWVEEKYFCINAEVEFSEYIFLNTWDPCLRESLGKLFITLQKLQKSRETHLTKKFIFTFPGKMTLETLKTSLKACKSQ